MSLTDCGPLGKSLFVDICDRHDGPPSTFLDRTKVTKASPHVYGSMVSIMERDLKLR